MICDAGYRDCECVLTGDDVLIASCPICGGSESVVCSGCEGCDGDYGDDYDDGTAL